MAKLESVNSETFEAKVLNASGPVLVDFWADWCPPCRALAPTLEELASELAGQLTVVKLDVQSTTDIPRQYDVMNIPTLILFKDGEEATRIVGNRPKRALKRELEPHL